MGKVTLLISIAIILFVMEGYKAQNGKDILTLSGRDSQNTESIGAQRKHKISPDIAF